MSAVSNSRTPSIQSGRRIANQSPIEELTDIKLQNQANQAKTSAKKDIEK